MNNPPKNPKAYNMSLKQHQLNVFFTDHLNRIYCVKAHLIERLPELAEQAEFQDLKHAILETCDDLGKQMARIVEIYELLDEIPDLENCAELVDFVEDGFNTIYQQREEPGLRDLSILFYLSLVESVEIASLQILQMIAVKLQAKQIRQLLQENFDESKADRILFLQITSKYIN